MIIALLYTCCCDGGVGLSCIENDLGSFRTPEKKGGGPKRGLEARGMGLVARHGERKGGRTCIDLLPHCTSKFHTKLCRPCRPVY